VLKFLEDDEMRPVICPGAEGVEDFQVGAIEPLGDFVETYASEES
jgi:hypothetical protein